MKKRQGWLKAAEEMCKKKGNLLFYKLTDIMLIFSINWPTLYDGMMMISETNSYYMKKSQCLMLDTSWVVGSIYAYTMEPTQFITFALACTQELYVKALFLKTSHTSGAKCREFKLELIEPLSLST